VVDEEHTGGVNLSFVYASTRVVKKVTIYHITRYFKKKVFHFIKSNIFSMPQYLFF
jgi:hypothetical protein